MLECANIQSADRGAALRTRDWVRQAREGQQRSGLKGFQLMGGRSTDGRSNVFPRWGAGEEEGW